MTTLEQSVRVLTRHGVAIPVAVLQRASKFLWIRSPDQYQASLESEVRPEIVAKRTNFGFGTLALVAEADAERSGLLPQGSFRSLHQLRELRYRRLCLRMLLEQFDVGCGVWFAGRSLLCCFGQFTLLEWDGTSYHLWSHHQAERFMVFLVRKRLTLVFVVSGCNFPATVEIPRRYRL